MPGKISLVFNISPLDEDVSIVELEQKVREISKEGLVWGGSKTEPIFGKLERLKISAIIDESVSVEDIEQDIADLEDYVQSVTCESMSLI